MNGPERHRRANHRHPAQQPRDGRAAQRELKRHRPMTVADLTPEQQVRIAPYLGAADGGYYNEAVGA